MSINELTTEDLFDRLAVALINYEANCDMLQAIPHRRFLDLAIVPVILSDNNDWSYEYVDVSFSKRYHLPAEFLIDFAISNSKRLYGTQMTSLHDFMSLLYEKCDLKDFYDMTDMENEGFETPLFILTNNTGFLGASVICFENIMKQLFNVFKTDFYVIPSSIHDVMIYPADEYVDKLFVKSILTNANDTVLSDTEKLSYNLYFYDSKKDELSIV